MLSRLLEKLMKEENIKIIKNAEVTEVITENKEVKSVRINNSQVIMSDYIICNSDPPSFYKKLIKSKKNYNFLFKQKIKEWIIRWVYLFITLVLEKNTKT